jgi:hypothetical protein
MKTAMVDLSHVSKHHIKFSLLTDTSNIHTEWSKSFTPMGILIYDDDDDD